MKLDITPDYGSGDLGSSPNMPAKEIMKKKLTLVRVWNRKDCHEYGCFITANYINDELQRDTDYYRQINEFEAKLRDTKIIYKTALTSGGW